MSEGLDVLQDISRRLALAGIPYMITGAMAMSLYARPRMTRDIDIVILLSAAGSWMCLASKSGSISWNCSPFGRWYGLEGYRP